MHDPRPADDGSIPARRPWYRLHRSTYAVLVVLGTVVTLLNVPGQLVVSPQFHPRGAHCFLLSRSHEHFDHGCPLTYLRRTPDYTHRPSSSLVGSVTWRSLWSLTQRIEEFNGVCLAIDLVVAAVAVALGVATYEAWRRRRQRAFQLHLIDLFLFTGLAAGLLAWLTIEVGQYREEQQTLVVLHRETYFFSQPGGPTWLRKLIGERPFQVFDRVVDIGEANGSVAGSFPHLRSFHNCCEGDLSCLEHLPRLEAIELATAATDDSELVHLRYCGRLKGLNLLDTNVTDEGIAHVANVPTLQYLELTGTRIGDDGIAHLAHLFRLRTLCLGLTAVTDDGLSHLEALDSLEFLDLSYTRVTEAGLEDLRKALPRCMISHKPIRPSPPETVSDSSAGPD